jgi:hypothetical protein
LNILGKPRAFDYDSITDLILTFRYTARPDGSRASAGAGSGKVAQK